MISLQIKTHEGEVFTLEVSEYDATSMNEQLNNSEINTVNIGGQIFSRFDIKRIISDETLTNV